MVDRKNKMIKRFRMSTHKMVDRKNKMIKRFRMSVVILLYQVMVLPIPFEVTFSEAFQVQVCFAWSYRTPTSCNFEHWKELWKM